MPLCDLYSAIDDLGAMQGGPGQAPVAAAPGTSARQPMLASMIVPPGVFAWETTPIDSSGGGGGQQWTLNTAAGFYDDGTAALYACNASFISGGSGGSISPGTVNGATIHAIRGDGTVDCSFVVALAGTLAQSFFTSITINSVQFDTASATCFDAGTITPGVSFWSWSTSPGALGTNTWTVDFDPATT